MRLLPLFQAIGKPAQRGPRQHMPIEDVSPSAGPCVCIDFGTSTSKVSILSGADGPMRDRVRPLAIGAACGADHPLLVPSVMFVENGRILFGPSALEVARRSADNNRDPILSFKTILAARDLEPTLALQVRRTVDPTGSLRHRDAFVLYLAYLNQLINIAASRDDTLPQNVASFPRRYTTPIWRAGAEADKVMLRLFDEAASVAERLGPGLTDREGVSIAQARAAVDLAGPHNGAGRLEAGVFEAYAAAAAYAAFSRAPKRFALVIDMGAGTTDITGFQQEGEGASLELTEIKAARNSCLLAGDEIDSILMNMLFDRLNLKQRPDKEHAWRVLRLTARKLKQELFDMGRCTFTLDGRRKATVKREELLKSREFKEFQAELHKICVASLRPIDERAKQSGADSIAILLAGGGANLPFLRPMVQSAANSMHAKAEIELFGEQWYLPQGFDPLLQSAYPQVAISLGGALARTAALVN